MLVAELSATAGQMSDGMVIGSVKESNLHAALTDIPIANAVYALRKDVTGTTFSFTDISAPAGDDTESDFLPWGTTAQMTAGDELLVSCDHEKAELFFKIATSGIWTGTVEIRYSNNGLTANAVLQNVVDSTNGFRAAAGIYSIAFDRPADIQAFSPVPGDIPSRQWFVLRPTITGVTTAPILSRLWIRHAETTVVDMSALINLDILTAGQGFGHPPNVFPTVGSSAYFAFQNPAFGMERDIFLRAGNTRTRLAEYLATDNTWKTMPGWTDPSNDYTTGPSPQAATATRYSVRWSMPADWPSVARSFTTSTGTVSYTGYWMRIRTTAVSTLGPMQVSVANLKARQFGTANTTGIKTLTASTLRGLSFSQYGQKNTATINAEAINMDTGKAEAFTIPANPDDPYMADFTDIALAAGQQWGLRIVSGGKIVSADVTER